MADTICHATQGGLMMLAPFIARIRSRRRILALAFLGAFFGALPDIIGAYGLLVRADHWHLYNVAHSGPLRDVLVYIPMYWLHLFVDSFTHGHGRRWWVWNERLWLEASLWALNAVIIAWYIRIRKAPGRKRDPGGPAGLSEPQRRRPAAR